MTKPINNIEVNFKTNYCIGPRQARVIAGIAFVALSAIALGGIALAAMSGANLGVFNALVGMKTLGAGVLLGFGAFVLGVLTYKVGCHFSLKYQLSNAKENFKFIFEKLDKAHICVWQQGTLDGKAITYLFIHHERNTVEVYLSEVSDESKEDKREPDALLKRIAAVIDQGFTLTNPRMDIFKQAE